MNNSINDLTIGQFKEISKLIGGGADSSVGTKSEGLCGMVGKKVIIRTYSAGVWFGELSEKSGTEVIIKNARRMHQWWAAESISLSAVAIYGIKQEKSKICQAVESVWLDAIEIIPCTDVAIESLEGAKNVQAS